MAESGKPIRARSSSSDTQRLRERVYRMRMHEAETHERAAKRHDEVAATFQRQHALEKVDHERMLAREERRKAAGARRRARAELSTDS